MSGLRSPVCLSVPSVQPTGRSPPFCSPFHPASHRHLHPPPPRSSPPSTASSFSVVAFLFLFFLPPPLLLLCVSTLLLPLAPGSQLYGKRVRWPAAVRREGEEDRDEDFSAKVDRFGSIDRLRLDLADPSTWFLRKRKIRRCTVVVSLTMKLKLKF